MASRPVQATIHRMGRPARQRRVTFEEYSAHEGAPNTRYELFAGEIVAMNQPTFRHAALQVSLAHELVAVLAGRCDVLGPTGVYCAATDEAFGPDLVVVCEPPTFDGKLGRALTNPRAIVEIVSPSTSQVDTIEKLAAYTTIGSLREYVIVSQSRRLVTVYRRSEAGWTIEQLSAGRLVVCDATLSVDSIYDRVDKPASSP